jgi:DNA repair exonuclease SbcCD nuclease subunit
VKIAHLADLHLGFRQFGRQTPQGINQREADVAAAFRRAIDGVIEAAPDVVVLAGDVFHSVRPTNPAILDSFNQFRRLRVGLPDAPVIIVAGNHDTPRSIETGTILKLFEALDNVHVVADETQRLVFDALDLAVMCVPHAALVVGERPVFRPPRGARWNMLVIHGEVAGVIPGDRSMLEYGGAIVEPADLHADQWSYVALGHYHVAHQVALNAWYAGSMEYVSLNPWGELREDVWLGSPGQKGWLLVTLESDGPSVEFQSVELARRHIDIEAVAGAGLTADEIDEQIAARANAVAGGLDGQVVRQVVFDVPRNVARDLDHAFIRELKTRALHYHLDLRRPQPTREVGVGAPGRRQTLRELVREYLSSRPLSPGVDRNALVALGNGYLDQVEGDLAER